MGGDESARAGLTADPSHANVHQVPEHALSAHPSEQDERVDLRDQLAWIAGARERPMARLVSLDGIDVEVPASAFATMHAVVRDMAQGLTITLPQSPPTQR